MHTLKRLQSGLAAKARETLGKKVISPTKIKIEKKEDNILDIALPNEPPKIVQNTIGPIQEKSKSKSPISHLPTIQSPVSSRSPSPALPLTREEAAIKIRSPSESPPPLPPVINKIESKKKKGKKHKKERSESPKASKKKEKSKKKKGEET